jgi:hypothetical protein
MTEEQKQLIALAEAELKACGLFAPASAKLMASFPEHAKTVLDWLRTARTSGILNSSNCQELFERVCARVSSPDFSLEPLPCYHSSSQASPVKLDELSPDSH